MASSKDEKVKEFRAYDFDGSEEFQRHLMNVELPANAASALVKVKARFYKKAVDPDFDPAWVTASSTAAPSAAQQQNGGPQPSAAAAAGRPPPPPAAAAAGGAAAGPPDGRTLTRVALQGLVLLLTLLYLQPFKATLSSWAWGALLNVILLAQASKIMSAHGPPPAWTLAAIRPWAARIGSTSDAHYFLLALAGRVSQPVTALLTPFFVLAMYNVAFFLSEHCSDHPLWRLHGAQAYATMMQHQQAALLFNAQSEILLGFFLIVGLVLPNRQPMLLLLVWNVLRMRYHSTDAAWYHRQIWGVFDEKSRGLRQRFPLLERVVGFGVAYFNAQRR